MSKVLLALAAVLFPLAGFAVAQSPGSNGPVLSGPIAVPSAPAPGMPGSIVSGQVGPGPIEPAPMGGYGPVAPGPAVGPPIGGYGSVGPGMPGPVIAGDAAGAAPPLGDACQGSYVVPWWFTGEYLLWWTKSMPVSAPLATSVAPGTPTGGTPVPGAIGGAGTSVVLGDSNIDLGDRSGGRFTLGHWFDDNGTLGVEGSYFFLGAVSTSQSISSAGGPNSPTLMIPFFDVTGTFTGGTPGQSALPVALKTLFTSPPNNASLANEFSGPFVGHDILSTFSQTQGAELNGVFGSYRNGRMRTDWLFGFRYLNLTETLDFDTFSHTPASAQTQFTFNTADSFYTGNNFFGGQLGWRMEYGGDTCCGSWWDRLSYTGSVKVALGDTVERMDINGTTTTNLGNPLLGSTQTFEGGAFTSTTNIGTSEFNHFAVVPEVDLSIGYRVLPWARLFIGYDFLYISDVLRPGNQIDPGVNLYRSGLVEQSSGPTAGTPITLPANNPARPAVNASQTDFWAQGLTFGVDVCF